jgi:glucokinase
MVCSGMGIPRIYGCLKDLYHMEEPLWLADQLKTADDPTPVIVEAAVSYEKSCDLAIATLDRFTSILGAEAANLALKVVATGGVYLGGGIPPRILPFLEQKRFLNAFGNKGIMTEMLVQIPIHIITNSDAALMGAASCML